jgi:hypothetical protein
MVNMVSLTLKMEVAASSYKFINICPTTSIMPQKALTFNHSCENLKFHIFNFIKLSLTLNTITIVLVIFMQNLRSIHLVTNTFKMNITVVPAQKTG